MPTGTTFDPKNANDFDKARMQFNAKGVSATCTINAATNLDLYFSEDHLVTGFWIVGSGLKLGDKVDLKVIDTDNIMGFGAGVAIKTLATDIYLPQSVDQQFDVAYPAKVLAGLSLRLIFRSSATTGDGPFVAINWKIHKVLV